MENFDFHCHPALKTFMMSTIEAERADCRNEVNFGVDKLVPIFNSQSSLTQMQKGGVNLAVACVYGLERAFALNFILRTVNRFSDEISDDLFKGIRDGTMGYNDWIKDEIKHLTRPSDDSPNVKIIKSIAEYDPNDKNTIHLILGVEGGHNFYPSPSPESFENEELTMANLLAFKQEHRPLYLTLVHLTKNIFANQAFGMKLISSPSFTPKDAGITDFGKQFIKAVLSNTNGKRILLDIKHLSLQSRLDYYEMLKTDPDLANVPILATHIGVTGGSFDSPDVARFSQNNTSPVLVDYNMRAGIDGTFFNQWSINLYDEDILTICKSGGLIGMSLDQRILGWGTIGVEQLSIEEDVLNLNGFDNVPTIDIPAQPFPTNKLKSEKFDGDVHLKYLCNNILHIVKVAGSSAWQQICIGSDFDGLIDAINCCLDAISMPQLADGLKRELPSMGILVDIPTPNIDQIVEDIMFNNAHRFLKKHFV